MEHKCSKLALFGGKNMKSLYAKSLGAALAAFLIAGSIEVASVLAGEKAQSKDAVAYQIDPAHSGEIDFASGFTTPLALAWSVPVSDYTMNYPLIVEGKVIVNSRSLNDYGSQIYAFDLSSGATLWHQLIGNLYGWSASAYDNGSVFLVDENGQLEALRAKSGKPEWLIQLANMGTFSAPPTASNGRIFVSGSNSELYSVDESSGNIEWTAGVTGGDNSSPTVTVRGVYASYSCQIYDFATDTGKLLWHVDEGGGGGGGETSIFYDKRLYVSDPFCGNLILDAKKGRNEGTFAANMPPAFFKDSQNINYGVAVNNGGLYAFSLATGNTAWTFAGDGELDTAPIVINGLIIVGSSSGNLYVVDGATGSEDWSTYMGAPIVGMNAGEGTLIVLAGAKVSAFVPQTSRR